MQIELFPPNEKQKLFLMDHHKHVAFGGARGGGKSYAVRMKAILMAMKHPGIKIMIIRKTYPELIANHIKPLREMCKCGTDDAIATYNDSRKELLFNNGSSLLFRYCNSESDPDRLQGTEIDILFSMKQHYYQRNRSKRSGPVCEVLMVFPRESTIPAIRVARAMHSLKGCSLIAITLIRNILKSTASFRAL